MKVCDIEESNIGVGKTLNIGSNQQTQGIMLAIGIGNHKILYIYNNLKYSNNYERKL